MFFTLNSMGTADQPEKAGEHILEFIVREYRWAKWREEAKTKSPSSFDKGPCSTAELGGRRTAFEHDP